jgi:hypothetical protein
LPPAQDWPLAPCDFRTIAEDDGAPITTYFVDELPEDPFGLVDHLRPVGNSWKIHHDPSQEWCTSPG